MWHIMPYIAGFAAKMIIVIIAGLCDVALAFATLKYYNYVCPTPPRDTPKIANPSTTCPG